MTSIVFKIEDAKQRIEVKMNSLLGYYEVVCFNKESRLSQVRETSSSKKDAILKAKRISNVRKEETT